MFEEFFNGNFVCSTDYVNCKQRVAAPVLASIIDEFMKTESVSENNGKPKTEEFRLVVRLVSR